MQSSKNDDFKNYKGENQLMLSMPAQIFTVHVTRKNRIND